MEATVEAVETTTTAFYAANNSSLGEKRAS